MADPRQIQEMLSNYQSQSTSAKPNPNPATPEVKTTSHGKVDELLDKLIDSTLILRDMLVGEDYPQEVREFLTTVFENTSANLQPLMELKAGKMDNIVRAMREKAGTDLKATKVPAGMSLEQAGNLLQTNRAKAQPFGAEQY